MYLNSKLIRPRGSRLTTPYGALGRVTSGVISEQADMLALISNREPVRRAKSS